MLKINVALFFILSARLICAQEIKKPISNINHMVGVDVGYTDYSSYLKTDGEININYIFNPYFFCIKSQIGIAPKSNFGTLTKTYITAGFSTNTNKIISWHFLFGFGSIVASNNNNDVFEGIIRPVIESGFYTKPFKDKRHVFGLNSTISTYTIHDNYRYSAIHRALNVNIIYNFKINK